MDRLTHHLLRRGLEDRPGGEAIVDGDRRVDYRTLDADTTRWAAALVDAGVARLDRVGVFFEKTYEEVVAMIAASKAGGVFVPIHAQLFPAQVAHILSDCRPAAIVTSRERIANLAEVLPGSSVRVVASIDGFDEGLPGIRCVDLRTVPADATTDVGDRNIGRDLACILYTSGSTGRPKGVMLSHDNLLAGSRIVSTYLRIGPEERILSVLPFSFDYGLNQLLTALEHGATLILLRFRFPHEVVQAIVRERATGLAGVPPFWTLFVQPTSSARKHDLSCLRYITNSGGAVPRPLLDALRETLPETDVVLMYGLTEAFRSTYLPPDELDRRPGSMGKAIPDTEVFVLGDDGTRCGPGEVGELVHRGPTVSMGYWGNPEATERVIRPNPLAIPETGDAEPVCFSGDLVKLDEDGFLYFVGRRDATIKSAGHRISPTEVEEVLVAIDGVQQAAAVGVPDDVLGHAVVAVLTLKDGATVEAAAVVEHCARHMPRYMVPRRVEILDGLPKTPNGKIDYPTLRERVVASATGT